MNTAQQKFIQLALQIIKQDRLTNQNVIIPCNKSTSTTRKNWYQNFGWLL